MNYEEWVKLWQKPLKINWSKPLTEEDKIKLSSQLPEIAEFLLQEQKELRQLKKLADKFKKAAATKDSEISKERLRMRLRKKLANKKEKEGLTHICSKDCKKRLQKREKKLLAAKKKLDVPKSKDPEFSEEHEPNLEGDKDYLQQYRDPDKSNDDDEKEEDSQKDEGEEDNDSENDGEEFNADVNTQPQDYSSPYETSDLSEKHQQHMLKMHVKLDQFGNIDESRYLNPYLPSHIFDNDRHHYDKEEIKGDEDDEDEVHGLQMKSLEMSEGPRQSHGEKVLSEEEDYGPLVLPSQEGPTSTSSNSTELEFSKDFSKFLNYKYHF